MSNRTLIIFSVLVIVSMLVLFALNMTDILTGQPLNQKFLKYNDVQGIAAVHNRLFYTLNFKQQNTVIDLLNEAIPIKEIKSSNRQPANINAIMVYQFAGKPALTITPIAYIDQNLVFSVPEWASEGYLMERSEGGLKQLLSQTYD